MTEHSTSDDRARRLLTVFAEVGVLYRQVYRRIEQDTLAQGISVGIRAVLELLAGGGPRTVPELARTLALSRQFVQRTVNDAAQAGLVEIRDNPRHRRSSLIAVTDRGRAALDTATARELAVLRDLGGDLTEAQVDACLAVLRHLRMSFADSEGTADAAP
ncbi:MarR family winged helix-turn-helix transcriptional regulator [Nocardia sp. SSK8]|uniref:MarR family winged helix-turn-helix transcriptional regulator n=1 Tax=Nocardia sp. SSK8 TaxID=3120154 RepID=UPI00300939AD